MAAALTTKSDPIQPQAPTDAELALRSAGLWSAPFAMAQATKNVPSESWYHIQAKAGDAEIMIYDDIGSWGVSAKQFATELRSLGDVRNIVLHIHSYGGDVFDGMAIYNLLVNHPAYITVHIDGVAASMASVIAMAGNNIIIPQNAMLMIHKPWGIQGGDAEDMRRYADLLDQIEGNLLSAYTKKTGKSAEEIALLLEQETWMTGSEAVEAGFADTLAQPLQAMACLNSKRLQDFKNMPQQIKAMLQPRGSANPQPAPTPAPQPEPAPAPQPDPTPTPAPAAGLTPEALTARNSAIRNLFASFGNRHQDMMIDALANPTMQLTEVKDQLLNALGKDLTPSDPAPAGAHIFAGNGNIVGDSMRAALMARCGHKADGTEQGDIKDNPYMGLQLREMARAALKDRSIGIAGANVQNMVGMAFTHTSSDFGNILMDVAHKSVLLGWEDSEETFETWTYKGQLSDFKPASRVGLDSFGPLRAVRDGAEYKYVTVGDRAEAIALATYGELFSITRQTIINDDLQMLLDIPMMMGEAAKATIGDLVYKVLTTSPKMSDQKALFHADHKNIFDASAGMSIEALGGARQMMRSQKAAGGARSLNIRPGFVLVPTALELSTQQIITSTSVKGADANSGISNPLQNFAQVIAEPRLDDQAKLDWYLAAGKGRDTIEVAYLDGIDTPYIEQQTGFTVDGVATKVRIDAGVAPRDFRGLVKATGSAK